MAVMLAFAAAVICAGAFKYLFSRPGCRQLAAFAILAVLVVEYLPKPIPSFVPIMPGHAGVLRGTPPGGGVLDASGEAFSYPRLATMSADQLADDMYGFTDAMYYQTFHRKPIAFGFMPRQPASVRAKDVEVAAALIGEQFDTLRNKFDIRYLAVRDAPPRVTTSPYVKVLYEQENVSLLGLEEVSFRETSFPSEPAVFHGIRRLNGKWESTGDDPRLVFELPKPTFVYAVRAKFRYEKAGDRARFQAFWRRHAQGFVETERTKSLELPTGPEANTVTIVINDTIDQFRIDPDNKPGVFEILELVVLVPEAAR
jgi:hypothetical protein